MEKSAILDFIITLVVNRYQEVTCGSTNLVANFCREDDENVTVKTRQEMPHAWVKSSALLGVITAMLTPGLAFAKKTNQAVYEEAFDLGGGGASLTRASQEGVMFANPALMPWGGKFFRWLGGEFTLLAARESIDFAKNMTGGGGSGEDAATIVDKVLKDKTPIHFGATTALSFITSHFGFGLFGRFEPDIYGEQYGPTGMPAITVSAEAYAGAVSSVATQLTDWLSFGVTGKYLYVAEPEIVLELTDEKRIEELSNDPNALQDAASFGTGVGFDAGFLLFLQGNTVDYRLALKADDIGDTQFSGTQAAFKQTLHAGTGITFHGGQNALHLSLDYRDLMGVYEEKPFKRVYAGAKVVLYNFLGLATGLYQGIPTAGIRLDAKIMTLGVTAYGREMGSTVDMRQRNLYVAYFGFGF